MTQTKLAKIHRSLLMRIGVRVTSEPQTEGSCETGCNSPDDNGGPAGLTSVPQGVRILVVHRYDTIE